MLQVRDRDRTASPERARLIESLVEVAAEHGYLETTIEMIVERAGLDRPAFDRHFRGKYDCFLSAWQELNEECMEEMLDAYNGEEDWVDRLRAVATGVALALRHDPARACFAVEVLAAGDAARARRDMTMRVIASLIDAGRREMEDPESIPRTTAEALAGSAYGQVYAKVVRGQAEELPAMVPQLMASAVMPYLGVDAALAELQRSLGEPALDGRGEPSERATVPGRGGDASEGPGLSFEAEAAGTREGGGEEFPPELARLPPGRHGLPPEFVARNQRERLIAGLAEAVAENGYAGATISHITRQATVSRRTFYEHFKDKDGCFVAAYETVMEELRIRVAAAFEAAEDWPLGVRGAVAAMLRFLSAEPNLARLAMVEAQVAGPVVVERYDAAIQSFVPYFRAGREGLPAEALERLSPTTEEALVGGMVSLISRRVLIGRTPELESLLPDLVEFVLTPYLGAEEASRVAGEGAATEG